MDDTFIVTAKVIIALIVLGLVFLAWAMLFHWIGVGP
jgi:hypothetical protein